MAKTPGPACVAQAVISKLETIEIILTVSTAETNRGLVVLANATLFYYW